MSCMGIKIFREGNFVHEYTLHLERNEVGKTADWMASRAASGVTFQFSEDGFPIQPIVNKKDEARP